MTCNNLHFIRIFSLFLSFILLEFYSYRFRVTIWFTIHVRIIQIVIFIILMPTLSHFGFRLKMKIGAKSWRLCKSYFLSYWSLSMLLVRLPLCLRISSLFFSGLVYIRISSFTVYVGIIHAKRALVVFSVVRCIHCLRICCCLLSVYIENETISFYCKIWKLRDNIDITDNLLA